MQLKPKLLAILLCPGLSLSACKIVETPTLEKQKEIAATQTDEARMGVYAESIWEDQVLPTVKEHLVPIAELRLKLNEGLDAAGATHGLRPEGATNPWNFAVSGQGTVIEANPESRAAKLKIDTNADGVQDATIQLGPIIRGTSLRDAMPFIVFTNFRDQIEFAKLARALNVQANSSLTIPSGDLLAKTVTFEGVFTLKKQTGKFEIVPTSLQFK